MKTKRTLRTIRRILGLLAFVGTGGGLIVSTAIHEGNYYKTEILVIFGALFAVSLVDQFIQTIREKDRHEDS